METLKLEHIAPYLPFKEIILNLAFFKGRCLSIRDLLKEAASLILR